MVVTQVMFASIRGRALHGASSGQILMVKRKINQVVTHSSSWSVSLSADGQTVAIGAHLSTTAMVVTLVMFASIRGRALRGASLGRI